MKYHKIQSVYKRDPDNKFKTFLEGVYSLPEFEYLENCTWHGTEKLDGTNIRLVYARLEGVGSLHVHGKTDNAQIHPLIIEAIERDYPTEKLDEVFASENEDESQLFVLYGEGVGPKVQSGGAYGMHRVVLFDIFCAFPTMWLKQADVDDIATKLEVGRAETAFHGTLPEAIEKVRKGFDSQHGTRPAEGLVLRPAHELQDRRGERIITKIKTKDFYHG